MVKCSCCRDADASRKAYQRALKYQRGKSYVLARYELESAIKRGCIRAYATLGHMHSKGLGTPKDVNEAVKCYRRGASRRDGMSMCNLGIMYLFGRGVRKNREEATKWLTRAVEAGVAQAARVLAEHEDDRVAMWELYNEAAEMGDPKAIRIVESRGRDGVA